MGQPLCFKLNSRSHTCIPAICNKWSVANVTFVTKMSNYRVTIIRNIVTIFSRSKSQFDASIKPDRYIISRIARSSSAGTMTFNPAAAPSSNGKKGQIQRIRSVVVLIKASNKNEGSSPFYSLFHHVSYFTSNYFGVPHNSSGNENVGTGKKIHRNTLPTAEGLQQPVWLWVLLSGGTRFVSNRKKNILAKSSFPDGVIFYPGYTSQMTMLSISPSNLHWTGR